MKKNILILIILMSFTSIMLRAEDYKFQVGGYVDTYFANDNVKSGDSRQFTFLNSQKNQFDINIAQISGNFNFKDLVRGKLTLQNGSLADVAYGGKMLQEAWVGTQLFDGFWIDAGYYLTHIGGESYLPKDNWLSTHSIVTYFEPFFHSGIKASYTSGKITACVHLCNGNGIFKDNNENKSLGLFLAYNFSDDYSISYASIIGNEEPKDKEPKTHFLNNFCVNAKILPKLEVKGQFDLATKEKVKPNDNNSNLDNGTYMGASASIRYSFSDKIKATARFSWFDDKDLVYTTGLNGIEANLGIEYKPNSNSYIRLEGVMLNFDEGTNEIGKVFFDNDGKKTNKRMQVSLNFGVWID